MGAKKNSSQKDSLRLQKKQINMLKKQEMFEERKKAERERAVIAAQSARARGFGLLTTGNAMKRQVNGSAI